MGQALITASEEGHLHNVKALLQSKANINVVGHGSKRKIDSPGGPPWSPLTCATFNGHRTVVGLLLSASANIDGSGGPYWGSALRTAVFTRNRDIVNLLLRKGATANTVGGANGSPLQLAACSGDRGIVQLLLQKGADPKLKGSRQHTPLETVNSAGQQNLVQLFLDTGGKLPEGLSKNTTHSPLPSLVQREKEPLPHLRINKALADGPHRNS